MTEKKQGTRALLVTILLIALIQMPQLAITPGIDLISEKIFPEWSFKTIQTVMSLPNMVAVFSGVFAAISARYGFFRKKTLVVAGLLIVASTGVAAFFLNTRFWQLILLNMLIGFGMGVFIPTAQSIMFDSFDEKTRQFISGTQFSFVNAGGIVMSVLGGLLTSLVWYGGHLVTLAAVPVAIVAFIIIPRDEKQRGTDTARTKLPGGVYYYTVIILIFMIMYSVGTSNLSTHIARGSIGDTATAGAVTAVMMAGGVVSGLLFPKLSPRLQDDLLSASFVMLSIGYTLMNLFPTSLAVTFVAMFICGSSISMFIPRCIFRVSNLTNASNSATATMLIASVAPGLGSFLSPVIITPVTQAISGNSTRFRYQFAALICLALAALVFIYNLRRSRLNAAAQPQAR